MLGELLKNDMVQFQKEVRNWEEAIEVASMPLLKNNYIEESYVRAMIRNVKEFGPYIVLLPHIAMPHSRPEDGVSKLGVSILITEKDVLFPNEKVANVFIVLAAVDSTSHLELLSQLMELLSSEEKVQTLIEATSYKELLSIL
ncbi:PTS sugar transporter subunit IIA [[Brevibacterium] frigoritolerans]|nr:PTS sugar transporter subunit IIA [Peribacillus frigoritolerans]